MSVSSGRGVRVVRMWCWCRRNMVLESSRRGVNHWDAVSASSGHGVGVGIVRRQEASSWSFARGETSRRDTTCKGKGQREDKERTNCNSTRMKLWLVGLIYRRSVGWSRVRHTQNLGERGRCCLPPGKAWREGVYVESGASKTSTLGTE